MTAPQIRYARTSDRVDISYCVYEGEGIPFLEVPWPGAPPLTLRHRIHANVAYVQQRRRQNTFVDVDLRGYGLSGAWTCKPNFEGWVLDIAAVVDAVGGRVHLSAWSGHSHEAAQFAAAHPESVASLTLFLPLMRGLFTRPEHSKLLLKANYRLALLYLLRTMYDLQEDEVAEDMIGSYAEGFTEAWIRESNPIPAFREARLEDSLRGVTVPVLILGFERRESWVAPAAAILPHAQLGLVPRGSINGRLGHAWREVFDGFWSAVSGKPAAQRNRGTATNTPPLSQRERQVLETIAAGYSNAEIAERLTLSTRTVERHVQNIYNKLGVHNRVEAANWAIRNGLDRGPA